MGNMPRGNPGIPKHYIVRGTFKKGSISWNKGKKGLQVAWNKGLTKKDKRVAKYSKSWTSKRREAQSKLLSRLNKKLKRGIKQKSSHIRRMKRGVRKYFKSNFQWNKGIPLGRIPCFGKRRFWYFGKDYKLRMRSRWEVSFAYWLDRRNEKWLYEAHCFVGENFSYTPDFYLLRQEMFVEIKGREKFLNLRKIDLVERCGANIMLLFGVDLKKLGVIIGRTYE
jgi:hypothetical protein